MAQAGQSSLRAVVDRSAGVLGVLGPVLALIALVIVGWAMNGRFVSPSNVRDILQKSSYVGVLAIGMSFVIFLGGIDLSVGSLLALAGGLGIWAMNTVIQAQALTGHGSGPSEAALSDSASTLRSGLAHAFVASGLDSREWAGVIVGVLVIFLIGLAAGLFHGMLVTLGRMAPFIATLGGLAAYRSIAKAVANGATFDSASDHLFPIFGAEGFAVPGLVNQYGRPVIFYWSIVVFFALAVLAQFVLSFTRYGRHVYAVGDNEKAARLSGVRVNRVKVIGYTLMGLCTAVAALLLASNQNSVSSGQTGLLKELDAIAAVVIGGASMRGGRGWIGGTVLGVLIITVISNLLILLGISGHLQGLAKGIIIIAAVLVQRNTQT